MSDAQTAFFRIHGLPRLTNREASTKGLWCFPIPRSRYGQSALTAWTYNPVAQRIRARESRIRRRHALLSDLVTEPGIFYGHQFKRMMQIPTSVLSYSVRVHVFQERPAGRWISKNPSRTIASTVVPDGAILVAAQGTMGDNELFGQCQFSHRGTSRKPHDHATHPACNSRHLRRSTLDTCLPSCRQNMAFNSCGAPNVEPSCWGSSSLWWRESLYRSPVKTSGTKLGRHDIPEPMIVEQMHCNLRIRHKSCLPRRWNCPKARDQPLDCGNTPAITPCEQGRSSEYAAR